MRKRLAGILGALVLALGGVLVAGPGVAQAVWSCHTNTTWPVYADAWCDFGAGGVAVLGDCWYPRDNFTVRYQGPWVPAGQVSRVICGGGSYVVHSGYVTF